MFCIALILFQHLFQSVCIGVLGRNEPFCFADHKWDHTVQKCISCHQGYFGLNCETKCPFPYYGFKCQLECNCIDKNCHHVSGCITASEACRHGYHGRNCDEKCPFPYYGFKCLSKCHCGDKDCHHVYGCRHSSRDVTTYDPSHTFRANTYESEPSTLSIKSSTLKEVDVSTNIDVPNKSTIPTSEWVSVSKASKSTPQDFPNERSKKHYNTLLPLATDENNHFGGVHCVCLSSPFGHFGHFACWLVGENENSNKCPSRDKSNAYIARHRQDERCAVRLESFPAAYSELSVECIKGCARNYKCNFGSYSA